MTEIDAAYIAGFFDGEGSCGCRIQIKRHQDNVPSYATQVSIVNTNRGILAHIQKITCLGLIYNKPRSSSKHKHAFVLDFPEHHVVKFLSLIQPYLHVKAKQVALVLELKAMVKDQVWNIEQQARRAAICFELRALNKRGN